MGDADVIALSPAESGPLVTRADLPAEVAEELEQ